jgi:hypothetical protein
LCHSHLQAMLFLSPVVDSRVEVSVLEFTVLGENLVAIGKSD